MAETTRTFVAIAIPDVIGRELLDLQATLAAEVPGCRWAASLPFHVTLAFLGDVDNPDLEQVCDAVARDAGPIEPFDLHLEGLGAFPSSKRPNVIWAGVSAANMKPLFDLREAVVRGVTGVGYRPDDLRFHPHVTLGRIKSARRDGGDLTGLLGRYQGWSREAFRVAEVITFASTLGPKGPSYAPIGRAPLAGKKTELPD